MSNSQPSSPAALVAEAVAAGSVIGVDLSSADVGGDGAVVTNPPVSSDLAATAQATTGAVNALADSQRVAGIRRSDVAITGNAEVVGEMSAATQAQAFTTMGSATAQAKLGDAAEPDAVGGIVNEAGSITAGGNALVRGVSGFLFGPSGSVGAAALSSGSLLDGLLARVSQPLRANVAQGLVADPALQAAVASSGVSTTNAVAATTTGDATAQSLMPTNYGINLDRLSIGFNGAVSGAVASSQVANASTQTGDAAAQVLNSTQDGVALGNLSIGRDADLRAQVASGNAAFASTTSGLSTAFAGGRPIGVGPFLSAQQLTGLSFPLIFPGSHIKPVHLGGDLALQAAASLAQFAVASNVAGDAQASATSAGFDAALSSATRVRGQEGDLIAPGDGVQPFQATASLVAAALASTTTGDAVALNGNETSNLLQQQRVDVAGLDGNGLPSPVALGGDLRGGGVFAGDLNLTSGASTTKGQALASNAGRVFGALSRTVKIGGSILPEGSVSQLGNGMLRFVSAGSAGTAASTTTAPAANAVGALAQTLLQGAGFLGPGAFDSSGNFDFSGTVVDVAGNGDLLFQNDLQATTSAAATRAEGEGVRADSVLRSAGYAPSVSNSASPIYGDAVPAGLANDLNIGGNGNVGLFSSVQAATTASNGSGPAQARSENRSTGALLIDDRISIGNQGLVAAEALVLPSTNTAQTTTGPAEAVVFSQATGLQGLGSSSVHAGSGDGSINALAGVEQQNGAFSVAGEVNALTSGTSAGISNLPLTAGVASGASVISGQSISAYNTVSETTTGDATAASAVSGVGIAQSPMQLGGNVVGISELANTVMATTVRGNAEASAVSSSVGIDASPIKILGDGSVIASASSIASSYAQTVFG